MAIKLDPKNARLHNEDNKAQINKSLSDLGAGRSIVIDNEDYVVAGNGVYEQAEALGLKTKIIETDGTELVVIKRTDLNYDDAKRRQLAIADNAAGETSEWNFDELTEDEIEEWGIEGYEEPTPEAVEDDFDTTPPENPQTVLGDLYEIGEHRLLCGDSTCADTVHTLMNGEKADMVFTDPPYGVDYEGGHNKKKREGIENDKLENKDLSNLFNDSINIACVFTKDTSPFYIWYASGKSMETLTGLSNTPIEIRAIICWYKVKSGLGAFMAQYIPNYEPCIYGHKSGQSIKWYGRTDEKTVWELKNDNKNKFHPTQKPIELCERAVNNSSKISDIILDVFLGSGSTMVAAHQLKRKCYGMELDPNYCDVIVNRMLSLDDTLTVKRNGIEETSKWKEKIKEAVTSD